MNKKLELKDLKDKKIIKLIKKFEDSISAEFCESEGYTNLGEEVVRKNKNIVIHKLVLYLNKILTNKNDK